MVFTSFLGTFTVNTYYTEIRAACAVQTELLWSGCLLPDSWGAVRRSNANPGDSSFLPLLWGGSRDSIQVVRSPSLEYQMPSLLSYLPGPRQYLQNSYKNKRGGWREGSVWGFAALQSTRVHFPAPTSDCSQLPGTLVAEDLLSLSSLPGQPQYAHK